MLAMNTITYCSNVHPTTSFDQLLSNLENHQSVVAQNLNRKQSFHEAQHLGLWIPQQLVSESWLRREELQRALQQHQLQIASFNAFPMGNFHQSSVKEKVYRPDWSQSERLSYTQDIARLGAQLLAPHHSNVDSYPTSKPSLKPASRPTFSISSLSGGFKPDDRPDKIQSYLEHWLDWIDYARELEHQTQVCAQLALEPEPFNTFEDHRDAIALWPRLLEMGHGRGLSKELIHRHLGLCFDTCHFSVRFIAPRQAWLELQEAGIPVHKIQVSVAPRCNSKNAEELDDFFSRDEAMYLHQSYFREESSGKIHEFLDLPAAASFQKQNKNHGEWRTHFHVPIHWGERPDTTGHELIDFLRLFKCSSEAKASSETKASSKAKSNEAETIGEKTRREGLPQEPLLEIETYSFANLKEHQESVLLDPAPLNLNSSITQEWLWLKRQLAN